MLFNQHSRVVQFVEQGRGQLFHISARFGQQDSAVSDDWLS